MYVFMYFFMYALMHVLIYLLLCTLCMLNRILLWEFSPSTSITIYIHTHGTFLQSDDVAVSISRRFADAVFSLGSSYVQVDM